MLADMVTIAVILLPFVYIVIQHYRGKINYESSVGVVPVEPEAPAPCPVCGGTQWLEVGRLRMIPAIGIRSFQFPEKGIAKIQHFKCIKCGSMGRYGLALENLKRGWILLDRWMGGW